MYHITNITINTNSINISQASQSYAIECLFTGFILLCIYIFVLAREKNKKKRNLSDNTSAGTQQPNEVDPKDVEVINDPNSSFSLYSSQPKLKKQKNEKNSKDVKKVIEITIQHVLQHNHTLHSQIRINDDAFTKWLYILSKEVTTSDLNIYLGYIRYGPTNTPYLLFEKIKIKNLATSFHFDQLDPDVGVEMQAELIIKDILDGKIVNYESVDKDYIDISKKPYYYPSATNEEGSEEEETIEEEDDEKDNEGDDGNEGEYEEKQIPKFKNQPLTFNNEQINNISFMKKNPFPIKNLKQGPTFNVPPRSAISEIVQLVFEKYFNIFIEILHQETNRYLEERRVQASIKCINPPWFTKYESFSLQDMKDYIGIFIFSGIQRVTNYKEFWEKPNSPFMYSSYHNVVASKMSFDKFKAIHRSLHFEGFGTEGSPTNFDILYSFANNLIKDLYLPSYDMSFDDDLFKWLGKGGQKIIPGKADGVGNVLWKLVDSSTYIYHFEMIN
ncbi:hypothetical protein CYY_010486 [Polysphondylium violaceum]|uniref:PiggyBac transposable element-derived protein domain-containing protein n=1 Tax=Polysphondylium violaceum TaxID=133409 RepID=A0A8J4V1J2_9MYCE|nr:hypothetical protein CYY_010486 [Polysphondylium violaceum]